MRECGSAKRHGLGKLLRPEAVLSALPHSLIPSFPHQSPRLAEITPAIPAIAATPSSVVIG